MAAGYHDFTAGETLTAANLEDYCELQSVMRFASAAARDSALSGVLTEGLAAYLIDLNKWTVYTGSAWSTIGPLHGALTSWSPNVTQGVAVSATVSYATYTRIGRLVWCTFSLAVTSSGTAGQPISVGTLPFACVTSGHIVGSGEVVDTSAAIKAEANILMVTTSSVDFRSASSVVNDNRVGVVTITAAIASGDFIYGTFMYEASADA